jgi:hypothetical protein
VGEADHHRPVFTAHHDDYARIPDQDPRPSLADSLAASV